MGSPTKAPDLAAQADLPTVQFPRSLIWIKAASDVPSSLGAGSGPDAADYPINTLKRDPTCPPPATTRMQRPRRRRMEIFAFLFLTAVLMPALAVATVGSYGLAVWIYQMVAGPPGPPAR